MERVNVYHRKDGRWEGRISRGKRKDGKRKYQYILARTREDVIDKMAEIRRNEQPTGKCHKTVDALFNEWFRSVQHLVKESTSANYAMKAEKHILPIFGNKSVSSIVSDDIYAFISQKQKAGLSVRYVADIVILMKTIFKYAMRTYHIFNPLDGVSLPKKKSPEIQLLDEALSELLGHSSVEITLNRYVHSSFEQKREYMKRLDLAF